VTAVLRNNRFKGISISFLVHIALFICGGFVLTKPIQYAVEMGNGGVELSLVAAPVESMTEDPIAIEEIPNDTPFSQPDVEELKSKQIQTATNSPYKGDGSSSVSGKDNTTFYSAGGAITEAKPNYLENPAPPYPWEARQKGWQGVVILKVVVDTFGRPIQVDKEQGSGYVILDDTALKTVKKWRFHPAQLGSMPVKSTVRVPIRFQLEH
jgi:protein TonB